MSSDTLRTVRLFSVKLCHINNISDLSVLVWEGGGDNRLDEGAEAAVWSNSSALALDARRAVRCGARLVRLQWRRADISGAPAWRDADLTSLHHHREVSSISVYVKCNMCLCMLFTYK